MFLCVLHRYSPDASQSETLHRHAGQELPLQKLQFLDTSIPSDLLDRSMQQTLLLALPEKVS
jgi:hypothetical protein